MITWIDANPEAGDVIPGAEGACKVHWKRAAAGKSGGVRVIYFNQTDEEVVLLAAVYAKAERENILPQGHPKGGVMNIENRQGHRGRCRRAAAGSAPGPRKAKAHVGRVTSPEQMLVRQAREASSMTQAAFAERIVTPVAILGDWEQGRFAPSGAVLCLLRLNIKHPELTAELAA